MEKNATIIKRNLTPSVQKLAESLVRRTGTIRIVLSAGIVALSKLTLEQKEMAIAEANSVDGAELLLNKDIKLNQCAAIAFDELISSYGEQNTLSAAVMLLHFMESKDREKFIAAVSKDNPDCIKACYDKLIAGFIERWSDAASPEDLNTAVKTVIKIISGKGVDVKMLPDEEKKIADFIFKTLGPKEPTHSHLKNKNA
jgi:hypothetical protein